jgi:hypothetical protein
MKNQFVQTELERPIPDGSVGRQTMISFIPEKLAVIGQVVDLQDPETDKWTRGWTVLPHCGETVDYEVANELSQQYKSQRVGSDIQRGSRDAMKKRRH